MDLARIKHLSGIITEAKKDVDPALEEPVEKEDPKADKAPKEEKAEKAPKSDTPPAVAAFVTSGLAKKLVSAGLATDPEEDEGASLIKIVMPFYTAGFKAGKAEAK